MFHELSEAFQGGMISLSKEKSSPMAGIEGSVYKEAHKRALPQGIYKGTFNNAPAPPTLNNLIRNIEFMNSYISK